MSKLGRLRPPKMDACHPSWRTNWRAPTVDLAVSVARNSVARRKDGWVPALFSRLRTGRIWYEPGLAVSEPEWIWTQLLMSIKNFRCTPILGPGLIEPLVGSHREIAQRWADKEGFPMAPSDRVDLPQVAQYLATTRGQGHMRTEFLNQLEKEVRRRDPGLTATGGVDSLISQASAPTHARPAAGSLLGPGPARPSDLYHRLPRPPPGRRPRRGR